MRGKTPTPEVERFRVRVGMSKDFPLDLCSDTSDGYNGIFFLTHPSGVKLTVAASDQLGWEHVSVSLPFRCPTWDEMQWVKTKFWNDEEAVIQIHPPRSLYVNRHPYCLHLWKPIGHSIPLPPKEFVG